MGSIFGAPNVWKLPFGFEGEHRKRQEAAMVHSKALMVTETNYFSCFHTSRGRRTLWCHEKINVDESASKSGIFDGESEHVVGQ